MTVIEFYHKICELPETVENRDLETYLSALYTLFEEHQTETLDAEKLLAFLTDAFTATPAPFNESWLSIIQSPDSNMLSKKFTNPEVNADIDNATISALEGYQFTQQVLQFQIAELHKMRDNQLTNENKYFGVRSETGHDWYNFDPFGNLECGARGIVDNSENDEDTLMVSWQTPGELLEMGRIYE